MIPKVGRGRSCAMRPHVLPSRKLGERFKMEGQRARILVIDDEERMRKVMHRALGPEYDVVVTSGGQGGLDRIVAGERFDLVLCDLMLPSMSGMVFHERVGKVAPELVEHIVFTTGGAYTHGAKAFLMRSDIRHIDKPFSLADLREAVREHLARTRRI